MNTQIDIVLIGVNAENTLQSCLESVLRCSWKDIRIFFVDGGSTDDSIRIARKFSHVEVIALRPEYPTPGLQRNVGWRAGCAPLVHFLDSDTTLDPDWLEKAVANMRSEVGAVCGNRKELKPEESVFNWIADLEWNAPPGECDVFGGDVLIRREVLEQCDGYDEELVGGEDPELSQRIRQMGWGIIQLNEPMTKHDLMMNTLKQYMRRNYRTGYGYAAVFTRHAGNLRGFWFDEVRRIMIRAGVPLVLICMGGVGLLWYWQAIIFILPALVLLCFPRIFRIHHFMEINKLSYCEAKIYAWHCSLAVLPQFFGMIRFLIGTFLFNYPLKNRPHKLSTGKT